MTDSHCHLDFKEFRGRLDSIIEAAHQAGVHTMINIGADLETSRNSVSLAMKYESVYATVGVHPHDARTYNDDVASELTALLGKSKVVAIGEIGLDYYRDLSPRPVQKKVFRQQLELAVKHQMPVVIHTREAFPETFEIVKEYSPRLPGGIFHCFPGTVEEAMQVIGIGFHISVGGVITFPNSRMAAVAAGVPLDRILLETDSPYLAPVPYRGKTNQPAYVRVVAEKLAALRNLSVEEIEKVTDRNCRKVYRLEETFGG
ncbi:MAG: TatD family hydrolase [Candidatus Zixiibacteriota bacterium]